MRGCKRCHWGLFYRRGEQNGWRNGDLGCLDTYAGPREFFWLEANVGHHNVPVTSGTGPWFARHSPTSDGVPDMRGVNSRNTVPYTVLAFKLNSESCVKCVDDLGDK